MSVNPLNIWQGFHPKDVLRLDVERDPAGAELLNLLPNPDAALGAWGWTTPVPDTRMTASSGVFTFTTSVSQPAYFTSDVFGCPAGRWVAAAWEVTGGTGGVHRVRFEWLDANKNLIYRSDFTGYLSTAAATRYTTAQAPTGTVYARIRFDINATIYDVDPTAGQTLSFNNPRVVAGTTSPIVVRTNLIINPSAEVDTSGLYPWTTTGTISNVPTLARVAGGAQGSWAVRLTDVQSGAGQDNHVIIGDPATQYPMRIPVTPNTSYTFSGYTKAVTTARQCGITVQWWFADGTSTPPQATPPSTTANTTSAYTRISRTAVSPSNAVAVSVSFAAYGIGTVGEQHLWDGFMVEASSSLGTYIEGTNLISGSLPVSPSAYYTTLAGELDTIGLNRSELDPGTLSVALAPNDSLDPAVNPLIRPGRKVRLLVTPNLAAPTVWEELFVGVIDQPKASYDLLRPGDKALVTFTATDAISRLASTGQPSGVATIANLPAVLEGAATAWNVNGSTNQVSNASVVAVDASASILDQIVRTRDSVLGFAWVDRHGVLQVWDSASISTTLADTLDETVYNGDPVIDFDTAVVINSVSVVVKDAAGNEVTYGPFTDPESVRVNGVFPATFTVQGISAGSVAGFAQSILTANATPVRRVQSVVVPITTANLPRTVRDLYDRVRVVNALAAIDTNMRITSVSHTITARSWLMTVSFTAEGRAAVPTVGTPVQSAPTFTDSPAAFRVGNVLIQTGTVTMPALAVDASSGQAVTFPKPFASAPLVQVSSGHGRVTASHGGVTSSGFTFTALNNGSAASSAQPGTWTAIGAAS